MISSRDIMDIPFGVTKISFYKICEEPHLEEYSDCLVEFYYNGKRWVDIFGRYKSAYDISEAINKAYNKEKNSKHCKFRIMLSVDDKDYQYNALGHSWKLTEKLSDGVLKGRNVQPKRKPIKKHNIRILENSVRRML